jgi:hypothetical protein
MGYTNILLVRDDAIRDAKSSNEVRKKLETEIGAGVIKVCLHPDYEPTEAGNLRIRDAALLNHGNGLSWVEEVHSSERGVYAWMGNCLRSIADLSDEELAVIKEMVDQQTSSRISKA